MKYYLDCEFDCVNGPLLSIALVREDGRDLYITVPFSSIKDPWVDQHVVPYLRSHYAQQVVSTTEECVGIFLRDFLILDDTPTIISDSMTDIGYFTRAYSSTHDGKYHPCKKPSVTFVVVDVDPYPSTDRTLVRHNAWADAQALKLKMEDKVSRALPAFLSDPNVLASPRPDDWPVSIKLPMVDFDTTDIDPSVDEGWEDIAGAPQDGELTVIYAPHPESQNPRFTTAGWYENGRWYMIDSCSYDLGFRADQPTRWNPKLTQSLRAKGFTHIRGIEIVKKHEGPSFKNKG